MMSNKEIKFEVKKSHKNFYLRFLSSIFRGFLSLVLAAVIAFVLVPEGRIYTLLMVMVILMITRGIPHAIIFSKYYLEYIKVERDFALIKYWRYNKFIELKLPVNEIYSKITTVSFGSRRLIEVRHKEKILFKQVENSVNDWSDDDIKKLNKDFNEIKDQIIANKSDI